MAMVSRRVISSWQRTCRNSRWPSSPARAWARRASRVSQHPGQFQGPQAAFRALLSIVVSAVTESPSSPVCRPVVVLGLARRRRPWRGCAPVATSAAAGGSDAAAAPDRCAAGSWSAWQLVAARLGAGTCALVAVGMAARWTSSRTAARARAGAPRRRRRRSAGAPGRSRCRRPGCL